MESAKQKFIVPELYGISIVLDILPGETYNCISERGWWTREKAIELIERRRPKDVSETALPSKELVFDAIDLAVRYGQFWHIHKTCKSIYPKEIMKEIT